MKEIIEALFVGRDSKRTWSPNGASPGASTIYTSIPSKNKQSVL
jgi:hypothetical protein